MIELNCVFIIVHFVLIMFRYVLITCLFVFIELYLVLIWIDTNVFLEHFEFC